MHTIRRSLLAAMLAASCAVASLPVLAQPAGPRHGPGGAGAPSVASLLLQPAVHAALNLNAAQETQWSALQGAAQALRSQLAAARAGLGSAIATELAKPTPDLAALDNAVAAEHAGAAAAMEALRTQALALYATFSTGQQAVVISAAQARYQRMRNMRDRHHG
ncbi:MAG TPA: periplasmic heavy metal sensor [Casimicrobiaceae bacterium]|nr:periplasmic heavy metal sensor [Casimicrobiaceae bacterium]